jgi:HEAT repeat protein
MLVAYLHLLVAAQPALPVKKPPVPVPPPAPMKATLAATDDQVLKAANLGTDGPALLEFFHKRSAPAPEQAQLEALLARLGDKTAETADKAVGELICLGPNAVPALRPVANNPDGGEATVRARRCLNMIEGNQGAALTAAAVRLLAVVKPEGAVEALLDYLPGAEDDHVVQEIETTLAAVGLRNGKPDPALVKALQDSVPVRRAVAAGVLCQIGGPAAYPVVRPLLKDPRPTVRLKVTLALVEANDATAVPVLIDLLSELPPAERKLAEDSLTHLAGEWAIVAPRGDDATSRRLRREMWSAWWKATQNSALLDEFRSRTLAESDRTAIVDLIAKLSDPSAEVRSKAEADLLALGPKVAPLLRRTVFVEGAKGKDAAAKCLQLVEKDAPPTLPQAAPRLLALHRPEGTVETLLAYMPCAETHDLEQQVRDLIAAISVGDAKAIGVLVKTLEDPAGVRRAAAAQALCKVRDGDHLAGVRKLLTDPDPEVRLRAALGLATLRDKEAVPVLVALLAEARIDLASEAEEYLLRVAGDKAPAAPLSTDAAARDKTRDVWATWWKDNAEAADLARADTAERSYGFQLVVESYDQVRRQLGRVFELDRAGKARWEITGLQYPISAQVIPGERVLIVEQNLNRVSEREFTGKVLWEKQYQQPFHVQRLRNGHTFVACRQHLIELDRDGKEIQNVPRFNETILAAQKLRDGHVGFLTYQGQYVRLDAAGKEVKTVRIPFVNSGNLYGEVLPNDHVLISQGGVNKVTEYDGDGKVVWQADVTFPGIPTRLANGHTLVPAQTNTRLVELDRTGKVVNEYKDLNYRPWRVSRR